MNKEKIVLNHEDIQSMIQIEKHKFVVENEIGAINIKYLYVSLAGPTLRQLTVVLAYKQIDDGWTFNKDAVILWSSLQQRCITAMKHFTSATTVKESAPISGLVELVRHDRKWNTQRAIVNDVDGREWNCTVNSNECSISKNIKWLMAGRK